MADWLDKIEVEIDRGRKAERDGTGGKARTAARRAVGLAVTEFQQRRGGKQYGADVMTQLGGIAEDLSLPGEVRDAALRLHSRISQDFTSPSRQPLADATVIINFIKQALVS